MKIRLQSLLYILGISFLLVNSGGVLSAESEPVMHKVDSVSMEQDSGQISGNNDMTHTDDSSMQSERRLRLMTIDNLIRSQRVAQRTHLPR